MTRDPPALVLLPGLDGTGDLFEPLLSRLDPSNHVRTGRRQSAPHNRRQFLVVARVRTAQAANAIAAFARVDVPTMYLQGTEDTLVPRSCADEVCRLAPKTRIVKVEAPHCVLQCAPDDAARAIGQFLKSV